MAQKTQKLVKAQSFFAWVLELNATDGSPVWVVDHRGGLRIFKSRSEAKNYFVHPATRKMSRAVKVRVEVSSVRGE